MILILEDKFTELVIHIMNPRISNHMVVSLGPWSNLEPLEPRTLEPAYSNILLSKPSLNHLLRLRQQLLYLCSHSRHLASSRKQTDSEIAFPTTGKVKVISLPRFKECKINPITSFL